MSPEDGLREGLQFINFLLQLTFRRLLRIVGRFVLFHKQIYAEAGLVKRVAVLTILLNLITFPVIAQIGTVTDSTLLSADYHYYDRPIDPNLYIIRPGEKLIVTFVNSNLPFFDSLILYL